MLNVFRCDCMMSIVLQFLEFATYARVWLCVVSCMQFCKFALTMPYKGAVEQIVKQCSHVSAVKKADQQDSS